MTCFRDFTTSIWQIFAGNLLMLATLIFYIAWWTISFRPNGDGNTAHAGLFIVAALFVGVAAIITMSIGINSLSQTGKGFPVMYILLGSFAFYIILLAVTKMAFHRPVTSELLLVIVWAAVEWSAIAVFFGCRRFSIGPAITLTVLVAIAAFAGIVCYIQHYNLNETSRFYNGLIPLIIDAGAVAVFLSVMAVFHNNKA